MKCQKCQGLVPGDRSLNRPQMRQALANVVAVLSEAEAKPEHIVPMTWYLTDKREHLARARSAPPTAS